MLVLPSLWLRLQAVCSFVVFFPFRWQSAFSWVALVVRPWHSSGSLPRSNLAFKSDARKAARRLTPALGLCKTPLYSKPMNKRTAFSFSGVLQCLFCRFHGLHLQALCSFSVFFPFRWRSVFSWVAPVVRPCHSSVSSPRSNLAFKSDAQKRRAA